VAIPVYSSVLVRYQGVSSDTPIPDVFVGAGTKWVIRDMRIYGNMSPIDNQKFIVSELPTEAAIAFFSWSINEQDLKIWEGRQVIDYLDGTGGLSFFFGTPSPIDVSISGYILTTP
jgi:hypothetical protein